MNYKKNITGLVAVVLMWAACGKADLPPDGFETPVFEVAYSTFDVDSVVQAGVNKVYLFTDYQDFDQQVVCTGTFARTDCPGADCPGTLTFEFKRLLSGPFLPDSVFHTGGFMYLSQDTTGGTSILRTTFNALNAGGYNNFSWRIDDQDQGTGPLLEVDFPNVSVTPKLVELTAQKPSGLRSVLHRKISPLVSGGNPFGVVNIDVRFDSSFFYRISAETSGTNYDSLVWNTFETDTVLFQDFLMPFYSVFVSDSAGNIASASLEGLTPNELPARTADFTYSVETIFIPFAPGEVAIQWIDVEGNIWRSDDGFQESTAFFTVTESEPYENNEKGDKTRKMRVNFSCRLYDANGESRDFSGEGVIAVGHP